MSRSSRINHALVNGIVSAHKEASFWRPYSDVELKAIFTDGEILEIKEFMAEMKAASDDNVRRAAAIERYSQLVAKILRVAKIVT